MKSGKNSKPVVLAFSAHDPTGAAGLQADIESVNQNGGICVSVITAVTAQNTASFKSVLPQSPAAFQQQLQTLMSDISVDICKIGLIGSELLIYEISDFLTDNEKLPVVLDPVLHAGTGARLDSDDIRTALLENLIPKVSILTPNLKEALNLTGKNNRESAAKDLLSRGCKHVLITGADQSTKEVINVLYSADTEAVEYSWERLPGTFHGSGCTLAASIAICLAKNNDVQAAVQQAQEYTWTTLKHGFKIGSTQLHPNRGL